MAKKNFFNKLSVKWGTIFAVIVIIAAGVCFIRYVCKENSNQLVQMIPKGAFYVLIINDNENFIKDYTKYNSYIDDLLFTSTIPGFEFFIDKACKKDNDKSILISSFIYGDATKLLMNISIDSEDFIHLLTKLKIDEKDFIPFEYYKIYSFGTHLKRFSFSFDDGILSVSEDIELLKKSILQHKHPKSLLSDVVFKKLFRLVVKNDKQNWIFLNRNSILDFYGNFFNSKMNTFLQAYSELSRWTAYQIRMEKQEITLSGYSYNEKGIFDYFKNQKPGQRSYFNIIPNNTAFIMSFSYSDYQKYINDYLLQNPHNEKYADSFLSLKPTEITHFIVCSDTLYYNYLALKKDTSQEIESMLFSDYISPSILTKYNNFNIYQSDNFRFNNFLSVVQKDINVRFLFEYNNYIIFAENECAIKYYIDNINKNRAMKLSSYSQSIADMLPSATSMENAIIFDELNKNSFSIFSDNTKYDKIKKDVKFIAFSYLPPEKSFIPINVFIKFN